MLNELEKSLEALARNEDKDLFKDLRIYKLETARQNPRSVPEKKEKFL